MPVVNTTRVLFQITSKIETVGTGAGETTRVRVNAKRTTESTRNRWCSNLPTEQDILLYDIGTTRPKLFM